MRRLAPLAYIAAVLAILFAGDRVGGFVLGQLVDRSEFRFSRIYRGGIDGDILAIGDSRARHQFSTSRPALTATAISPTCCTSTSRVRWRWRRY